jgi:hypothetical protein
VEKYLLILLGNTSLRGVIFRVKQSWSLLRIGLFFESNSDNREVIHLSLKAIEMQIALPRTQDAGKLQEQLQQRGQIQNDFALLDAQKEELQKRMGITGNEQKDGVRLRQDQKEDRRRQDAEEQRKKKKQAVKEHHPYKGTRIDFSG